VIEALLDAWPLFGPTWVAGASIALLLALAGVWVVARDQVFLGAAISQASTLGIAALLWLAGLDAARDLAWLETPALTGACAVAASVTTALLTVAPRRPGSESAEARTAWIFLLAASLPMLLLAHSAHGLEEVHRLMFSTLLGVAPEDVWVLGTLALATAAAVLRWREPLLLFALDPEMAAAVGLRTERWGRVIAVWLGVALGVSIHVAGLIYTFGCLVLPALVAKNLCREMKPVLVVAPGVAVTSAAVAFGLAHATDVPPAHAAVALLCALVALTWLRRRA
jgi:ABC-type Mn2+/Zn2+ transport system permease subunit